MDGASFSPSSVSMNTPPPRHSTGRRESSGGRTRADVSNARVYGMGSSERRNQSSRSSYASQSNSSPSSIPTASASATKIPSMSSSSSKTKRSPVKRSLMPPISSSERNRLHHHSTPPASQKRQIRSSSSSRASPKDTPVSNTKPESSPHSAPVSLHDGGSKSRQVPVHQTPSQHPLSPPQQQACLDASLMMLRTSMEDHSKPYEYLFERNNTDCGASGSIGKSETGPGNEEWLSLVHKLQTKREQESLQLKRDLQRQKKKTKQYRAELRSNLSERLHFLEDRVLSSQQEQLQSHSDGQHPPPLIATASNSSSHGGGSTTTTSQSSSQGDDNSSNPTYEVVYKGGTPRNSSTPQRASNDTEELRQQLERSQMENAREKRDWLRRLDILEGRYTSDLESWQKEVTTLKDEGRRLLEERNHLSSQLNGSADGHNVHSKLFQVERERDNAMKLLEQLQREYEMQQEALEHSQNKAKDAKETARTAQILFKSELKALDEPIAEVEAEYKESVKKCNELQSRLRQVEARHADDKATWKLQLEGALASARKEASQNEALAEQLEKVQSEIKALEHQHAKDTKEWNMYAAEKTRAAAAASEVEEVHQMQLNHVYQEIDQLTSDKEDAVKDAQEASNQLAALKKEHLEEVQSLRLQIQEAEDARSERKDSVDEKLAQALELHSEETRQMQMAHAEELSVLQKELEAMKKSLKGAQLSHVSLMEIARLKETDTKYDESQKEIDSLQTKNSDLTQEFESLKAESSTTEQQLRKLQEEKEQLQLTNKSLEQKVSDMGREIQDVSAKLESSQAQLKDMQQNDETTELRVKLEASQSQIKDLEEKFKQADLLMAEKEEEWNTKLKASQTQAEELQEKFKQVDLLMLEKEEKWNVESADYQSQLKDLGRQCAAIDSVSKNHVQRAEETKSNHDREIAELRRKLADSEREYLELETEKNILSSKLEEVDTSSNNGNWEAEASRLKEENSKLVAKLESKQINEEALAVVQKSIADGFEQYRKDFSCAVLELRGDIAVVTEAVQEAQEESRQQSTSRQTSDMNNVNKVHTSIVDALAELTLETENLIECRTGIQTLVQRTNDLLKPNKAHNNKELKVQMTSLEALLNQVLDGAISVDKSKMLSEEQRSDLLGMKERLAKEQDERQRLEKLLDRKEELLTWEKQNRKRVEEKLRSMEDQEEQLVFERKMRFKAENEIKTLNDQADAYGEEVMRLQGINTEMEEALKEAELRMASALAPTETAEVVAVHSEHHDSPEKPLDFSSPMLDEALALAQNLTALMQDQEGAERETSVMEMLETISDMIDQGTPPSLNKPPVTQIEIPKEVKIATPISNKHQKEMDCIDENEEPPPPIMSPPHPILNQSSTKELPSGELTLVVEQLYGRCQLLERERTEIMEVALDILQSARDASSAELEAALATARRKSAEELLRVREENQKSILRLHHKLCGTCQVDLMRPDSLSNIS